MPEWAHATTSDGVRLALRRYGGGPGSGRGVLLCTHAMWVNSASLTRLAGAAASAGVDVWLLDFRGHGASVPPSPRRGPMWSFDDYVERDLPAALDLVAARAGVRPEEIAYLGHSLGGLVALAAFGTGLTPQPRRLCLASVSCWRHGPRGPLTRRLAIGAFDWSARLFGYAPLRALGLGTDDEPVSYVSQLAGWTRAGRWTSRGGVDYAASIQAIRSPTLATVSTKDPLCTEADVRDLIDRLPAPAELVQVPGDHFALFRAAGAPFWPRVIDFLCPP